MKMIIHMSVIEPGENVLGETFRWDRLTEPMPGWEIKVTWFREDGLPTKGMFMGTYCSGPKWRWADKTLRTALTNNCLVNASEEQREEYMAETDLTFNEYITESLGPGCIEDCGDPITWTYDYHDTPFNLEVVMGGPGGSHLMECSCARVRTRVPARVGVVCVWLWLWAVLSAVVKFLGPLQMGLAPL